MKFINILSSFILVLLVISCSQFGDSFRLPGEKSKDIIYFELDNDYLAPESREYIELNHSSNDISNSYILIGKNTYGFEADLNNDMSLSFDEDGSLRKTREHPFLKDNYKKGRFDKEDKEDKEEEGRDKDGKDKDEDKDGRDKDEERERCFEFVMPYNLIMPDGSSISIEKDEDKRLIDEWYKDNPDEKDRPEPEFPITVVIAGEDEDKEEVTLENEDELKELIAACNDFDKEREECFEVVMPFSMELPDGSIVTIEEDEDHKQIEDWYINNPDSKERASFVFPIEILINEKKEDEDEEGQVITINNEEELKKVASRCRGDKGKKDRCKKLHGDEIPDCIKEYVSSNYPDDEITHSRMLRTKDGDVFYVVKLKENGILKFDEDCEFLD